MNWLTVWVIVLGGGIAVFAGLAVYVAIGGAKDIRSMLRTLERRAEEDRR